MRRAMARVRGDADAAGFTLVEMLTVMILGSVIGVAVMSAIVSGLRSQTRVDAHQTSLEQTRVALQRVTREIRGLAVLEQAFPNDLIFDLKRPSGFRREELTTATANGRTDLVLLTTDFTGSGCTTDTQLACTHGSPTPTTILPSVANSSSTPLFTFQGPRTGYTVPAGQTVDTGTCIRANQTPVQADQGCPNMIRVRLLQLIKGAPNNRPTDLKDDVQLRNLP